MGSITEVDYLTQARSRYTQQFKNKPIFDAHINIFITEITEIQDMLQDLIGLRSLETAVGSQLDMIGAIVGQPRALVNFFLFPFFGFDGASQAQTFGSLYDAALGGTWKSISDSEGASFEVDDDTYRLIIRARIIANISNTTPQGVIDAVNYIVGRTDSSIVEMGNAHLKITHYATLTTLQEYFLRGLSSIGSIIPLPICVSYEIEYLERGDDWVGGINTDSDLFFSNVISLLHFNGLEGSQVVVDEIGNTWDIFSYVGGDPSVGIVENKHGIDSAFVINYNRSEYSSPAELRLETPLEFSIFDSTIGDCTIELFFKNTGGVEGWLLYSNTGSGTFPSGTSSSFRAGLYSDRLAVIGHYYTPSTGNYFLPDFEVPLEFVPHGVWNHIAFVVSGNTLKCFINGVLRKSETISRTSGLSYEAPNHYLMVSSANKTVDEFRITSGVARYSANFARPIKQFPDHD